MYNMHPWKMKVQPLWGEVVERGRGLPSRQYIVYQETNGMLSVNLWYAAEPQQQDFVSPSNM